MLTEQSQRILAELEEAGFENVSCIINTVSRPSGDYKELAENVAAFHELILNGLAQVAYENKGLGKLESISREASMKAITDFEKMIDFDVAEDIWKWDRHTPRAYLRLTELGLQKAHQILNERGYQWWLQRS